MKKKMTLQGVCPKQVPQMTINSYLTKSKKKKKDATLLSSLSLSLSLSPPPPSFCSLAAVVPEVVFSYLWPTLKCTKDRCKMRMV